MTEMQRQFEEWAVTTKDKFGLPFFTIKDESGKYVDHATEISWQAWQASRAAIVVKLPNGFHDKYEQYVYDCASLELSLDEAGVSYE